MKLEFSTSGETMHNNWRTESLVAIGLIVAIAILLLALFGRSARGDGLPPPLPYQAPQPSQSCMLTAIQLGYLTGRREVGWQGIAACTAFTREQGVVVRPNEYQYLGRPPLR